MTSILKKSVSSFFVRRFSSFTYLNVTQFLGALNDNIYKFLIVYFLIQIDGIENTHRIMAFTGATFVIPFLLFSASSGIMADRFSKRNVIAFTKILEMFIMVLGIVAFYYESKIGSYFILFLLATQSAIFGPSKYGILPELVSSDKISRANGLMTSFTFLAIILGTFFASFVLDISNRDFMIAALMCNVIALIGMITSFCIEYTRPSGSHTPFNVLFFKEIYDTLKFARQSPSLLMAILGAAFFLFLGAFMQLNIIPFAIESLHLTDIQGGYIFLLTAVGIGIGSLIAGKISGPIVELGIVPIAGLGVAICCYLLDLFSDHLYTALPLVALTGMFGGMYQIPLDSYIQVASPNKNRGQIVAATNFLSFCGVLAASVMVWMISDVLKFRADKGFTIMGSLTLGVTTVIAFQYFDYLTRFVSMILSRLHFQTTYVGIKNIPDGPAIYVCYHKAWNETLIILGSQRHRMRFFIEHEKNHTKWLRRLYGLLRVVLISAPEPLENNKECLNAIKYSLDNDISVCIFVNEPNIEKEIEKLEQSYKFQKIFDDKQYPIIPVVIEQGEKDKKSKLFEKLLKKFRVPAEITFGSEWGKPSDESELSRSLS